MRTPTLALFVCASIFSSVLFANNGDTTIVETHNASHWSWYGSIDHSGLFPDTTHHYRKITLHYKLGCPSPHCSAWDYTTQIFIMHHTGRYDSTLVQDPHFTVNGNSPDSVLFNTHATYTYYYDTTAHVTDSTLNVQMMIVQFNDSLNPTSPSDTIYVWPGNYYNYIFDASGNVTDSAWVAADSLWHNGYYTAYNHFEVIEQIEIARYITPYAQNLGPTWNNTWDFDVTDYAPLLHDSVDIRAFYSGWSDGFTVTLDFEMIEGTPPRTPKRVMNLWSGYFPYGDPNNTIENYLVPKSVVLLPGEQNSKVHLDITGHGFGGTEDCSEFCPKMYYLKFNNTIRYQGLVWRDKCGMNPLSAQPGTWLYDRANWCPGERVYPYDDDLTPYANPGDTVSIDLDMQSFTNLDLSHGAGYQVDGQLITYSAPNFPLDAELVEILAPNKILNDNHFNPVCNKPVVIIRNTGGFPLTSLVITYGVTGAPSSTYTWNGNLAFLQTDTVYLPAMNWFSTSPEFFATVSNPNGMTDMYADNNTLHTSYIATPMYIGDLVFECRTNLSGGEESYTVTDASGNVLLDRNSLNSSATYRDTLHLAPGCYIFRLYDSAKDGLSFWANNDGAGYMHFKNANTGGLVKSFNPDFGTDLYQEFTVGYNLPVQNILPDHAALFVYPNPTSGMLTIDVQSPDKVSEVVVTDALGQIISDRKVDTQNGMQTLDVDLSDDAPGIYFVQLRSNGTTVTKKVVRQ